MGKCESGIRVERGIGKRIWKLLGWLFEKRNNVGRQWAQISWANTCGRKSKWQWRVQGAWAPLAFSLWVAVGPCLLWTLVSMSVLLAIIKSMRTCRLYKNNLYSI